MYLAVILLFVCIAQSTQYPNQQIRLGNSFTTHLCTIHPWPELCETDLSRGYGNHPRPLSMIFKPAYGSMRFTPGKNDAKKLIRALRSIDKAEADKKSDKSYDFIRFG